MADEPPSDSRKPDRKMTNDEVDQAVRRRIERQRTEVIRDAE